MYESKTFGNDLKKVLPVVHEDGSDSAMFDNALEFMHLAGRPLPLAMMMMIPEPWQNHEGMSKERKAFYEYHSCLMEPWDGPASIAFTDGTMVGAVLDRNGLRPSRYYVLKNDVVVMASEVGVLDIPNDMVEYKGRLKPGCMLLIDTAEGRIIDDEEIKAKYANEKPYGEWLEEYLISLDELPDPPTIHAPDHDTVLQRQQVFGFSYEDIRQILIPMASDGVEPVGAMGIDSPLAVLANEPQLLFSYFKQLFAQVTNPPIDGIRELIVTATTTLIGSEGNLLHPEPVNCRQVEVKSPVLTNEELEKLRHIDKPGFASTTIPMLYDVNGGGAALAAALDDIFLKADEAIGNGTNIIILSDRNVSAEKAPIPSLLATAGLHHHLIRSGKRTHVGLVIESGEPREVHHFALLIGYGASAVNPYMVYESIDDMIRNGILKTTKYEKGVYNYSKAAVKGISKTMTKMGISTIQSYCGAQIFEALGVNKSVIDKYFTHSPSRIGGIDLDIIAEEVRRRHIHGFPTRSENIAPLSEGGHYQWRADGEYHMYNPESIYVFQTAVRNADYGLFKKFAKMMDEQGSRPVNLRGLMKFKKFNPIPIEEVESVESICKRFKTGAMSYGSISKEAHESLAIAMNRIGGKSNTGEGGENPRRFTPDENGDSRCSAIKQVASGRFGVTLEYLVNAKEIQIKMAQGAKPGEGGQLPGAKVYPWIAKTRYTTPGVGLISPPPHHDIYSIEDLAELIHDLKNANRDARISVKLVAEVGVGTIAAGVAKGHADVILISGYDGGTGSSPRSSIRHAGLPWELGLADTHQTLVLNNLRDRVVLETDGKLMTGRDVVIAALLGAEEYGFATLPLVALGCVMMRVCSLDTCPVGVATQNRELRKCFKGDPQHVVNMMYYIAQNAREIMAELGFRTINEMIGRSDLLELSDTVQHWKAGTVNLDAILHRPVESDEVGVCCMVAQEHGIENSLDVKQLLDICKPAIDNGEKVRAELSISNVNRVVGTITGSEIAKKYGREGLPEDTIQIKFKGSAGQSFGAFIPKGMTLELEGDSNDYIGKGLSGGKIIVYPPSGIVAEENIVIGNVAFYGATSGEAYIRGIAGERFCVRNSGAKTVVESVGDHGCEYMTGGRVAVLGSTGRNFAAGMSGGIAYIYDKDGNFSNHCNTQMVEIEDLEVDDFAELKSMIENHLKYTGSDVAKAILDDWDNTLRKFVRVMPIDFKRMLAVMDKMREAGLSGDDAVMAAFENNKRDLSRVGGN
jgi:glutamate synthase (ferredoxin)